MSTNRQNLSIYNSRGKGQSGPGESPAGRLLGNRKPKKSPESIQDLTISACCSLKREARGGWSGGSN
jgi:hypothetical protein